jgi:hypothetical protein
MISDPEKVLLLYGPTVGTLTSNLFCIGSSLDTACCELARDCTLERVDMMLARLQAATASVVCMRKALVAEQGE